MRSLLFLLASVQIQVLIQSNFCVKTFKAAPPINEIRYFRLFIIVQLDHLSLILDDVLNLWYLYIQRCNITSIVM
jgi:hypothetical protein